MHHVPRLCGFFPKSPIWYEGSEQAAVSTAQQRAVRAPRGAEPHLTEAQQVLRQTGVPHTGQQLAQPLLQLRHQLLSPCAGLVVTAGLTDVHHAIWQAGQHFVQVICKTDKSLINQLNLLHQCFPTRTPDAPRFCSIPVPYQTSGP